MRSLQTAILALAQPPEVQISIYPDGCEKQDELALGFDDAFRYWMPRKKKELKDKEKKALEDIDAFLESMSGEVSSVLWSDSALFEEAAWKEVRVLAKEALIVFNWEFIEHTPKTWANKVAHEINVTTLSKRIWDYHRLKVECLECDLILGLGSYDLRVVDHCVELYQKGVAPIILFSGALGNWTRDMWKQPEAQIFRERAIELGVPSDHIILECDARNLGENIVFSRRALVEKRIEVESITLVTKPNTLRRAYATGRKVWPEKDFFTDCPQFDFLEQPTQDRSESDIINEMVGDLERIQKYPELGYQIEQNIPDEVTQAFKELVDLGFTSHMMKEKA